MDPIKFKEATVQLSKPKSMSDDECGSLWIYQQNNECIPCWTVSLWHRFKFLFHGKIWIGILSGNTQPPIWLDCTKTVFTGSDK